MLRGGFEVATEARDPVQPAGCPRRGARQGAAKVLPFQWGKGRVSHGSETHVCLQNLEPAASEAV